jgi:hypothetical protein
MSTSLVDATATHPTIGGVQIAGQNVVYFHYGESRTLNTPYTPDQLVFIFNFLESINNLKVQLTGLKLYNLASLFSIDPDWIFQPDFMSQEATAGLINNYLMLVQNLRSYCINDEQGQDRRISPSTSLESFFEILSSRLDIGRVEINPITTEIYILKGRKNDGVAKILEEILAQFASRFIEA